MKGIMEEKKKRWRPSLGAYRALENEVSELKEQLRLQLKADEYLSKEKKDLEVRLEAAKGEISLLKKGCKDGSALVECIERFEDASREASDTISMLVRECDAWREQYCELKNRGLWARILNR